MIEATAADALAQVEAELSALGGDAARAAAACAAVLAAADAHPTEAAPFLGRVGELLAGSRNRAAAAAVFACLAERAADAAGSGAVLDAMLQVRERPLRLRAAAALGAAAARGLVPDVALLDRLAGALIDVTEPVPGLALVLAHRAAGAPLHRLLGAVQPPSVRALAARVLDESGELPGPGACAAALGPAAAARLGWYLSFTRATHRDLLRLMPDSAPGVPLLASLDAAERVLGAEPLARIIAALGWSRVALGLEATSLAGVRVDGAFPAFVRPAEATLLEECSGVSRGARVVAVVAHGTVESTEAGPRAAAHAETIRRFRDYNVVHAELLNDILEVAPVTAGKARRILRRVRSIADDFAVLFAAHDEEAARAPAVARVLAGRVEALLPVADDVILEPGATRVVQAFEEPSSLAAVTTVHGLKRYLHQRGLRNAFRLFHSGAAANRCADLVLLDGAGMHVAQRIRYIEFEPHGAAAGLPPLVRLVADAYQQWLLHGSRRLPDVRLLIYAHEVQLYLSFRAHPAFIRFDLSPPRRGGMIDLEYFAVSQNELGQHPALHLPAIQAFLRRLGFLVELDGVRLHARYDKERAFDRADILEKAAALLRLAPLLMDLDWTIGGLAYSRDARAAVQEAWWRFFAREGVLPFGPLLTADGTRILCGRDGDRELDWDGSGAYRDRFTPADGAAWWPRLRRVLAERGLGGIVRTDHVTAPPGQQELERTVLVPLRAAQARGEVVEGDGVLRPAPPGTFRRVHEAVRLATLLEEGGRALEGGLRLATVLREVAGQFRFRTTGSVQGYPVRRADLALSSGPMLLAALCDDGGVPLLAFAAEGVSAAELRDPATGRWHWHGEPGAAAVLERLLRDNYLGLPADAAADTAADAARLRAVLARPPLRPPRPLLPGDRVVQGEAAAPGRAAGVARLGAGRPATRLAGAVLAAPVIRPEDAPLLRAASAIVTTGGGILSHAGLIAQELGKPSLLVRGRWVHEGGSAAALRLRRPEHREQRVAVGPWETACWEPVGEHDEVVGEGDLVAVDADGGTLRVLGQDRQALALHHGLDELQQAAGLLGATSEHGRVLELRGRLLRAMHGLRRVLRELDAPWLAHHAVRQLFAAETEPAAAGASAERAELLRVLLDNAATGSHAAEAAAAATGELLARLARLDEQARATIEVLDSPLEILFLRLALVRAVEALRAVDRIHALPPPARARLDGAAAIDGLTARRLAARRRQLQAAAESCRGTPDAWRLRHLARQLAAIDLVLGPARASAVPPGPPPPAADLPLPAGPPAPVAAGRWIVSADEGGIELAAAIGNKAAGLGELERILGPGLVPAWFAVTDRAFRTVLGTTIHGSTGAPMLLSEAISATLERDDLDEARKAAAVGSLWDAVEVPRAIRDAVAAACAGLGADTAVAIRSSSFEEDRPDAAWAGQFSTYLNVRGLDAVVAHLKKAWAGLWNERALQRRGRAVAPGGGVIVQRMVDARAAGVLHTASAVSADLRRMVVNAGLGLGAGIVSGVVGVDEIRILKGPDAAAPVLDVQYRIGDKRERVVPDAAAGAGTLIAETVYHQRFRAALEYSEVLELAAVAARLEAVMGEPLDIEFALEGHALRVLQVRPIPLFHGVLTETLRRHPLQVES